MELGSQVKWILARWEVKWIGELNEKDYAGLGGGNGLGYKMEGFPKSY